MKRSGLIAGAIFATMVLALGACGSDDEKSSGSDETTTTTEGKSKPSASATPTTDLTQDQEVTVSVKGFKSGLTLGINECAQAGDAEVGQNDCDLSAIKTITVGSDGTGTGPMIVSKGPIGQAAHMCGTPDVRCFLSVGELTAEPDAQRADDIDLTFAP